jgi:hypothetical protein
MTAVVANFKISLTLLTVCMLAAFALGYYLHPSGTEQVHYLTKTIEIPVPEFVTKQAPASAITYNGYKRQYISTGELKGITPLPVHDTITYRDSIPVYVPSFIACIDTSIQSGSVTMNANVCFEYPSAMFSWNIKTTPVSTQITLPVIQQQQVANRPLWVDILSHAGAGVVGYYIGKGSK